MRGVTGTVGVVLVSKTCLLRVEVHMRAHATVKVVPREGDRERKFGAADSGTRDTCVEGNRYLELRRCCATVSS